MPVHPFGYVKRRAAQMLVPHPRRPLDVADPESPDIPLTYCRSCSIGVHRCADLFEHPELGLVSCCCPDCWRCVNGCLIGVQPDPATVAMKPCGCPVKDHPGCRC